MSRVSSDKQGSSALYFTMVPLQPMIIYLIICTCMLVVSVPPGEAEEGEGGRLRGRPSWLRETPGVGVPQEFKRHLHTANHSCGT